MEVNTFKYDKVLQIDMTQVSLTLPKNMLDLIKKESKKLGYRSAQEYILQTMREQVFAKELDDKVAKMEKGANVTFKSKKAAIDFLQSRYGIRIQQ